MYSLLNYIYLQSIFSLKYFLATWVCLLFVVYAVNLNNKIASYFTSRNEFVNGEFHSVALVLEFGQERIQSQALKEVRI